jgi:hypothetical protein
VEEIVYYTRLCIKNEAAKQDLDQFFFQRQMADENMYTRLARLRQVLAGLSALLLRPVKKGVHIP